MYLLKLGDLESKDQVETAQWLGQTSHMLMVQGSEYGAGVSADSIR